MTDDPDGSVYRTRHRAATPPDLRAEGDGSDDGMMSIRLPIASTGAVRNEGDDPLTREELAGMAEQVDALDRGVFPEHGRSDDISDGRYSQTEKLGYWSDGEVEREASADGEDLLMATANMPDPETLPAATGEYRTTLAIYKEQAKRDIPMDASIGWRADDDFPGGNDLMEVSIVGIGADPRTTADAEAGLVARAAVDAGADPDALVREVRQAVGGDGRAEYEVGDETVEITPPEYMADAADLAMQKSAEGLGSDCGTGVGDDRADQIRDDAVGPDVVAEIAAYLTSHEEDVTADGPPSEWSDQEWDDCGNIQYAKWGGDGSGDALDWAQDRANAVADARGEELPYPNRAGRNLDDPEFSEGDAVSWDWQGDTVHGRVAGDPAESVTVDGTTIDGDDGEAVYPIHEYDEAVAAFRRRNVAKPESSLSESTKDLPPATDENFQTMTDDDAGTDAGTDDAQDAPDDGDGTNRAPDDLTEERLATFTAVHYDGFDESDVMEAADAADAEFVGSADVEETIDLVSVVTGAEYDAVESMMDELMGETNEGEKPDDDEDDDEDEQNADPDDGDGDRSVEQKVDALEEQLDKLRRGELDIGESDDDGADGDADGRDADADGDDADSTETRDDEGDTDPAPIRVSDL